MPKISVVIPAYNAEKTIAKTIQSVLDQTFKDFEIIVINDGSSDRTLEIVESFVDSRIQIYSYPNTGAAISRNRGISLASGEFLALLDADDLWTADKLTAQFQALQDYSEAGVAYSWTDYIDESDRFVRSGLHLSANGNVLPELLVHNFLENGSNPLIRSPIIQEVGQFDPHLLASMDWDFYLRLANFCHFIVVPRPQVLYRISTTSITTDVRRQEKESLKVIEKAFQQVPDSLRLLKQKSLANLYKYLACKSLENPSRKNGISTLLFLFNYAKYESLQQNTLKLIFILAIKGIFFLIFGSQKRNNLNISS
ncbi:MAG: glycosyltransferase [Cyanobacteria bacterium SBLK]|nr:glycosyltransferase [Cyanobacteria bacterium SBLK]